MKMIARYERDNGLNVREKPEGGANVVRVMERGEECECLEIRDGWAKFADGFAKVAFLVVQLGDTIKTLSKTVEEAAGSAAEVVREAAGAVEAAQTDEPAPVDDGEAAELRAMTARQLRDLAEQSGIKVRKGATKDELIAAIVSDE